MKKILFALLLCASYLLPGIAFSQSKTYFHDRIDTTIYATTTGTDTYTGTNTDPNFNVAGYMRGLMVSTFIVNGNTGAATYRLVTRTGTLASAAIKKQNGAALVAGDIPDSTAVLLLYYGSFWRLEGIYTTATSAWSLTGNAGTTAGTNFIGTTDNTNFILKRNNIQKAKFTTLDIFFGANSGSSLTSGYNNYCLGDSALYSLTTGYFNTAIGHLSMWKSTTAFENVSGGTHSMYQNVSGNLNTAYGVDALYQNRVANSNTAIGNRALENTNISGLADGTQNTGIGASAGRGNTSGSYNFFGAYEAGKNNTSGSGNTFIGYQAAYTNTTGSENVCLGHAADIADGLTNAIAIGYNTTVGASNSMRLGNGVNVGIGTSTPSYGLHIAGADGAGSQIGFSGGSTAAIFGSETNGFSIGSTTANKKLFFYAGNQPVSVTVDYDGNTAMGTLTDALTRLHLDNTLYVDAPQTNTVFDGNVANGKANIIGSDGEWAIRTGTANDFNLDLFNDFSAPRFNTLKISQRGDYTFTRGASGISTASTEFPFMIFDASTLREWAAGAIAFQREMKYLAPTYGFASASTITDAAFAYYDGAPISDGNSTITNTHAIYIASHDVTVSGAATNSYGLTVNAQTGATNNYAAQFVGGNVTLLTSRLTETQGADVASVAGAIAVGSDGNTFELTGTNAVTLISNLNWQNGSKITFVFTSTATLTDGTANSGTDIGMELAGNANFVGSADDVITLVLSEIGGVQRWREVSRSIN